MKIKSIWWFFLISFMGMGLWAGKILLFALSPANPNAGESVGQAIEIQRGQSPHEITKALSSMGILAEPEEWLFLGKITQRWRKIKAGEYLVSGQMTNWTLYITLMSGVSISHPLTIREGENFYEITADLESRKLVKNNHFGELAQNQNFIESLNLRSEPPLLSLEGYLYPDTYFINRSSTDRELLRQMTKRFLDHWSAGYETRAKALNFTRHQIITLASIIEKETGAAEERPLISSVFHNRLKKKMRLQSDPTTIYGIWERYEGKIHKTDLMEKTAYNTYAIDGLPPGPIGNPGKESIEAALFPVESPYLYFVSQNDGTHQFSRTLEEHNFNVRKYQLDPSAREGKSWRDRLKLKAQPH